MKKITQMKKREKTDAELTVELCRQEGMLGPQLQLRYGVVRNGEAIWVLMGDLSLQEMQIIHGELLRQGEAAMKLADSLEKETAK